MTKVETKIERARIRVRVDNGRLTAIDAAAQEQIDKLPLGVIVVEADEEDPTDSLRALYMAGMNELFLNVDGTGPGKTWPTMTSLRKFILKEIGFAQAVVRIDGVKWVPLSMSRNEMGYDDLKTCLELTRAYVVDRWGFDYWDEEHRKNR